MRGELEGLLSHWNRVDFRRLLRGASVKRRSRRIGVNCPTGLDVEAAVVKPPLLVGARWEIDQAGLRQPSEKKGGTKLNTDVRSGAECGWALHACKDKSFCIE